MIIYEVKNEYEFLMALLFAKSGHGKHEKNFIVFTGDENLIFHKISITNFNNLYFINASTFAEKLNFLIFAIRDFDKKNSKLYTFHEISLLTFTAVIVKTKLNLIEHGEINYIDIHEVYKKINKYHPYRILKLLSNERFVGENRLFKKIYLKDISKASWTICGKCEQFDPLSLFNQLRDQEKIHLFKYFGITYEELNIPPGSTILVTQPFSELGWMGEVEKIKMYQDLIQQCSGKVIIKPHPKENTNYLKHFQNVEVISKSVPFELLTLANNDSFDVLTINSSVSVLPNINVKRMEIEHIRKYKDAK